MDHRPIGAVRLDGSRTRFRVWAPGASSVDVHILEPDDRLVPLEPGDRGYWHATVEDAGPGTRYRYRLDGDRERPDPASRLQPEGVGGPSEVIALHDFAWSDAAWFGIPLRDLVIYELHVGTYTPDGTFDAIVDHLDELRDLGVTAIELMPVAQFPGSRNWGYDGVYPYAVHTTYGGPRGLQRLVDACHARRLAVVVDAVYNHLGPEGSYHRDYGPYFTDRYRTPWGEALNFDGPGSDEVRAHFIGSALGWFRDFHVDALRLDAVHAILDTSALPFLEELAIETAGLSDELNRRFHLIAESADNDARIITPRELGGFGLDAQWNDDFHHALYAHVTGDRSGYYADYGTLEHLATALRDGYVYQGDYSSHRGRRHGRSSRHRGAQRFVVFTRNHDQVGNRMDGSRLTTRLGPEELKLACGVLLLSPYIPLLFMGEEYGETAPFLYFVDHSDPELLESVREGRRQEFAAFGWEGEPPDPAASTTFEASKLDHALRTKERHAMLRGFYAEALRLRKEFPPLAQVSKDAMHVVADERNGVLTLHRWTDDDEAVVLAHFGTGETEVPFPVPRGRWSLILDSADGHWHGPGGIVPAELDGTETLTLSPHSLVVYRTPREDR